MDRRYAALSILALLLCATMAGAVDPQPRQGEASGPEAAIAALKQAKEISGQVWKMVAPWLQRGAQWAQSAGGDVFTIVYEKASLQGLRSVATEAGRIAFNFFSGRPYQAAYQVAKDVPIVGKAVKDVVGEANLRKRAARERVEDNEEL